MYILKRAHCVSAWGHDFRHDYLKLGDIRLAYKSIPWIALTATASSKVVDDVLLQLKLNSPLRFKNPCFRSNLFYDMQFKDIIEDTYLHLYEFCVKSLGDNWEETKKSERSCGIVYCRTREMTVDVAEVLTKKGLLTKAYHAGLKGSEREIVQEQWMKGEVPVITATISFGMGVDKGSVRFVAHWSPPQSVAGYYQESGRAGRDGKKAFCRIYYSKSERDAVAFLIKQDAAKSKNEAQAKSAMQGYEAMVSYCQEPICRHNFFAKYFGDSKIKNCGPMCDLCTNPKAADDLVQKVFYQDVIRRQLQVNALNVNGVDEDLYGGGRAGTIRDTSSYDGCDGSMEKKAKSSLSTLIQKQFSLRRGSGSGSENGDFVTAAKLVDDQLLSKARVRAAAATSTKIAGLTILSREQTLNLLLDALEKNYEKAKEVNPVAISKNLTKSDILDCAVELEYSIFSTKTVASMYKRGMVLLTSKIRKDTESGELTASIINFESVIKPSSSSSPALSSTSKRDVFDDSLNSHLLLIDTDSMEDSGLSSHSGVLSTQSTSHSSQNSQNGKRYSFKRKRSPTRQQTLGEFFQPISTDFTDDDIVMYEPTSEEDGTNNKESGIAQDETIELDSSSDEGNSSVQPQIQTKEYDHHEIKSSDIKTETVSAAVIINNLDLPKKLDPMQNVGRKRTRFSDATDFISTNDKALDEPTLTAAKTLITDKNSGGDRQHHRNSSGNTNFVEKEKGDASDKVPPSSLNNKSKTAIGLLNDLFGNAGAKGKGSSNNCGNSNSSSNSTDKKPKVEQRSPEKRIVEHDSSKKKPITSTVLKRSSDSSTASSYTSSGDDSSSNGVKIKSNSSSSKTESAKIRKQEMADIVIGYLMPFFKNKKIESKDKFKLLARDYSHQAIKRGLKTKPEVESFVKKSFAKSKSSSSSIVAATSLSKKSS